MIVDIDFQTLGYSYDPVHRFWRRHEIQEFSYSDGDETENRIYNIIASATDLSVSSPQLREASVDWPSKYHFSSSRGNILRPLANHLRGNVLEIGAGCGAITRYLGENGGKIYAVEGSARRARIAAARVRDLPNVCVVNDSFESFQPDFKFDAITLIGVLEYAGAFGKGPNPVHEILVRAKRLLKPTGILIIAIENQLGLKYFAGVPEDHLSIPRIGIQGLYPPNGVQTFGRVDLENRIRCAGFNNIELALPFPDYKLPISIVLPGGLNSSSFDPGSLAAQTASRDSQVSANDLNFSIDCVLKVVSDNNLLHEVSNSFLFVASPMLDSNIFDPNYLAYHYSLDRRPAFCKQVLFSINSDDQISSSQSYIYAAAADKGLVAKESSLGYTHTLPSEPFYKGVVFGEKIVTEFHRPNWGLNSVAIFFREYLEVLCLHLGMDFDQINQDTLVPGQLLDAVPQNIISINNEHCFFDQEWSSREPFPLGYLVFRSITTVVRMISSFAVPADTRLLNQGELFRQIFTRLDFQLTQQNFEDYSLRESKFMSFATGSLECPLAYDDWANHRLPSYLDRDQSTAATLVQHLHDVQNLADTYIAQIKWLESENDRRREQIELLEQKNAKQSEELLSISEELMEIKNSAVWRFFSKVMHK